MDSEIPYEYNLAFDLGEPQASETFSVTGSDNDDATDDDDAPLTTTIINSVIPENSKPASSWGMQTFGAAPVPLPTAYNVSASPAITYNFATAEDLHQHVFNDNYASPLARTKALYQDIIKNIGTFTNGYIECYMSRIGAILNSFDETTPIHLVHALEQSLYGLCCDQSKYTCLHEIYAALCGALQQAGINLGDLPNTVLNPNPGQYSILSYVAQSYLFPIGPSNLSEVLTLDILGKGANYYNSLTQKSNNNVPNSGTLELIDSMNTFSYLINNEAPPHY